MGHSTIAVTLDLYGHLMPGSEAEAAGLLDTYLEAQIDQAAEAARGAGDPLTGGEDWGAGGVRKREPHG